MKLLAAGPSPYTAKAAMALTFAGIDYETVQVDANGGDERLDRANPLSKIPALVLDDGSSVFDSRSITSWADRNGTRRLFPDSDPQRTQVERMEALCDGVCDSLVGAIYEMRFRPEEKVHEPWRERLLGKAWRSLDHIAKDLPPSGDDAHMGSVALAAVLGYLDLRYKGEWEDGRDALIEWRDAFAASHPDVAALMPHA